MANEIVTAPISAQSPFDSIRRVDEDGEFWIGRELMPLLGYQQWRQFSDAIERAIAAQENSGNATHRHFLRTLAKTEGRPKQDYRLSRLAAYLTAMNGDPRKPEVAAAQSYFAVKTHEAETVIPAQNERLRELELEIQLRNAEAHSALAQQKLLDTRYYITTALPEALQQKVLGYAEVKTVEYRDRVYHDDDLVRDGNTVNKTTLCKRLKFFTKSGKPDFRRLNDFLTACNLPESAWQLTAAIQENLELTSEAALEVERRWVASPSRNRYLGEN